MFSDAEVAELYDVLNPWDGGRPDSAFYDPLVAAADSVLDVGCGTGTMLAHARAAGHRGRLVGLDPDPSMLDRARRHPDIEWIGATAADATWDREFDLVTMTGHAFQCLVGDDQLHSSLVAVRRALRDDGRFVFETRHPQARAWLTWTPANASTVTTPDGRVLRVSHHVESVVGDVVTLTETTALPDGSASRVDRADLRFLDVPTLSAALTRAGLTIETQYGDWNHSPLTPTSREIITTTRRT